MPFPPPARPARLTAWIKDSGQALAHARREIQWVADLACATEAAARRRALERALRRQRAGGPGYDPARHLALLHACRAEGGVPAR